MIRCAIPVMLVILILLGCSGEEKFAVDNIPPLKPNLIHHLGDTGDMIGGQTINYYLDEEMEYNGIDALPGGNWIQIQWDHLLDNDLEKVEVYRFSLQDYSAYQQYLLNGGEEYDFTTKIDETTPDNKFYFDQSSGLLGFNWFYYLKVIDIAGNWTKSDTVCYKLMDKHVPIQPINPGTYTLNNLLFEWELTGEQAPSTTRLLIFDENYNLIWTYTPLDYEDTAVEYGGPDFEGGILRWRVDGFTPVIMTEEVNGQLYQIHSGSESYEYEILVR
ncbi:MAG: hypothetical protein JW996_07250 [Candidatus Cloacimonetes bacterium]|nr:hypothetical protein [Candidatus Cloacimonadota bacterium]